MSRLAGRNCSCRTNDGRILTFTPPDWAAEITNTGGRPLGFISTWRRPSHRRCHAWFITVERRQHDLLTDSYGDRPLVFTDDVDVADGTIWFSDASERFSVEDELDIVDRVQMDAYATLTPLREKRKKGSPRFILQTAS